jgi:hypothetical protein
VALAPPPVELLSGPASRSVPDWYESSRETLRRQLSLPRFTRRQRGAAAAAELRLAAPAGRAPEAAFRIDGSGLVREMVGAVDADSAVLAAAWRALRNAGGVTGAEVRTDDPLLLPLAFADADLGRVGVHSRLLAFAAGLPLDPAAREDPERFVELEVALGAAACQERADEESARGRVAFLEVPEGESNLDRELRARGFRELIQVLRFAL